MKIGMNEYNSIDILKYGTMIACFFIGMIAGFYRYDGLAIFCAIIFSAGIIEDAIK